MNTYLATAGALAFLVGLVHSFLGERLIFRRMRTHGLVPTNGAKLIGEGHVRIIWASWHIVTVLGWLASALLLWLSFSPVANPNQGVIVYAISVAMFISAALVLFATKARHPGWLGLLAVSILAWYGRAS